MCKAVRDSYGAPLTDHSGHRLQYETFLPPSDSLGRSVPSCLASVRASQMQEGDIERKIFHEKELRFLIVDPPRVISRLEERALDHASRTGGTVSVCGMRLVRLTPVRPHVALKTLSSHRAAVLLAVDGSHNSANTSEYQRKSAEARVKGDHARAEFFLDLHHVCAKWGKFDSTKIFDPDLSTPSKMTPMLIKFQPGSANRQLHLPMRRFTPPQKDEIRKQLLKMIQHKVVERGGVDAWVSCVHLARKRDAVAPDNPTGVEASKPAALNSIGAFMTWSDYEHIPGVPPTTLLNSISSELSTPPLAEEIAPLGMSCPIPR